MENDFGVRKMKNSHSFLHQWQYQSRDFDFTAANRLADVLAAEDDPITVRRIICEELVLRRLNKICLHALLCYCRINLPGTGDNVPDGSGWQDLPLLRGQKLAVVVNGSDTLM